jgi:protoheme IX farnesyltransferase
MTPIAQVETGANASVAAAAPATTVAAAPAVTITNARSHTLLSDLNQLFKTRVSLMVVITAWAGFYLGSVYSRISSLNLGLLQALVGVALVSCGASALNEAMERTSDARMVRTAQRPLASGRMPLPVGIGLGLATVIAGAFCLARFTNLLTVALALLTVFTYVAIYTPLKRHTTLATFIGAFPGAMPPLLGWTAARGRIEWPAVVLFAILFVWQFPHFMAIAWMYREDYARAGYQVLPLGTGKERFMGWQSVLPALSLVSVTFAPMALRHANSGLVAGTLLLSLGFLYFAARLALIRTSQSARRLLLVSIVYLPLVFLLVVLARV